MSDDSDTRRLDALRAALAKRPATPAPAEPSTALVPAAPVPPVAAGPGFVERLPTPRNGTPTVVVTPAGLDLVRHLAAEDNGWALIAKALGIGSRTLDAARKRQPEIDDAFALGRSQLAAELTSILLTEARKGGKVGIIAAMFLGKARLGWREQGVPDGAQPQVNVQVINLPAAATEADYLKSLPAADPPVIDAEIVEGETEGEPEGESDGEGDD